MKKGIIIALAAVLVAGGVFVAVKSADKPGEPAPVETVAPTPTPTPEPTPEPTPTPTPEPETTPMKAIANGVPAVYCTLNAGDEVEIVDEPDELPQYYLVKYQEVYGLVRKDQVKAEGEETFEEFTGYARSKAKFYSSYFLNDTEPQELKMNTTIQVLEELDYCYYVDFEGTKGFMRIDEVSPNYISYSYSGGGGSSSGGQDGGDISLVAYVAPREGEKKGTAVVKLDGTELILALYDFGDEVPVLEIKDDTAEVYLFGLTAKVEARLLWTEEGDLPESKVGYACDESGLYDNFRLYGEPVLTIKRNTQVEVLAELEDSIVVRFEDVICHMAAGGISDTPVTTYSYSGGGESSSGGGEWTEPVL